MPDEIHDSFASATVDGFTVSTNSETEDEIKANLVESQEKPKDGAPPDPEKEAQERASKAGAELGKRGGEATAAKRAEGKTEEKGAEKKEADADKGEAKKASEELGEDGKPLGKPRHDARARMLDATRKEAEAKRQLAAEREEKRQLEERVRRLEHTAAAVTGQPMPEDSRGRHPGGEPPPKEEDFDNYADYLDARTRHATREEHERISRQQQEEAFIFFKAKESVDKEMKRWDIYKQRVKEIAPDIITRVDPSLLKLKPSSLVPEGEHPTAANCIADDIIDSERPADLMLHLTENPEIFERLLQLPSRQAISREIIRIEARLPNGKAEEKKPVPVSHAKPPVTPVSGSSQSSSEEITDDMPFERHVAVMNAKERQRRGRY